MQTSEDPKEFLRSIAKIDVPTEPLEIRQRRRDDRFARREGFVSLRREGSVSKRCNLIGNDQGVGLAQVFG